MMVVGALILLCVVVPVILPIFVPLIVVFVFIQRRYLRTSRELKRFEAVTRSPVYQSFSNILKGLTVIRVFKCQDKFRRSFLDLLTINVSWWYSWVSSARWIGFRLDFLVAILMTAAPLLMVGLRDTLGEDNVKLVGLALSQSLYLAGLLQWMVRQTAEVENNMTSAERVFAYTNLEREPPTQSEGGPLPPGGWPTEGSIAYDDVDVVYRKGLPPVLRNLSFRIKGGTSCGIVGRTGGGKSSLMLSLFRLIPVTSGTISIDGPDIQSIAIDLLRKQIAIIPQDPVLFSGSLRSNLVGVDLGRALGFPVPFRLPPMGAASIRGFRLTLSLVLRATRFDRSPGPVREALGRLDLARAGEGPAQEPRRLDGGQGTVRRAPGGRQ